MAAVTNTQEMCSLSGDEHSDHSTKNTVWLQNGKIPPWSPTWPHPRHSALDNFLKFSKLWLSHLYNEKYDYYLTELLEGFSTIADDHLRAQYLDCSSRWSTSKT